jgi:hypothetical protein
MPKQTIVVFPGGDVSNPALVLEKRVRWVPEVSGSTISIKFYNKNAPLKRWKDGQKTGKEPDGERKTEAAPGDYLYQVTITARGGRPRRSHLNPKLIVQAVRPKGRSKPRGGSKIEGRTTR